MDRRKMKFLLPAVGIVVSIVFLVAVGIGQSDGFAYYLTVGEYVGKSLPSGENVRINGKVQQGSIVRADSGMDVRFVMTDGSAALPVSYHGIIPDTFVDGADVVVEGNRSSDGTFVAKNMLAKCPSKYEAADASEHPEDVPRYGPQSE